MVMVSMLQLFNLTIVLTYPPVPSKILLSTKPNISENSFSRQGRESGTADTCNLFNEDRKIVNINYKTEWGYL